MNDLSAAIDDPEVRREEVIQIVGEDFYHPLKTPQELPDREIIWQMADNRYGCPDMASLRITGSIGEWKWFANLIEEEGRIASTDGHILEVQTGYKALPEFRLLVLNIRKEDLKGVLTQRVRSLGDVGVEGQEQLPRHKVDVRELVAAIRGAHTHIAS